MAGNKDSAALSDLDARIEEKRRELEEKQKELDALLGQKRELEGSGNGTAEQPAAKKQKVAAVREPRKYPQRSVKDLRIVAEFGQQMGKVTSRKGRTVCTSDLHTHAPVGRLSQCLSRPVTRTFWRSWAARLDGTTLVGSASAF